MNWEPHALVAGKYRLISQLGKGGMGAVWKAEHVSLKSEVALKQIDVALAASGDAVARFMREAQAAASLRSTHVVQILDHGVDDGVPYIAMELLRGEALAQRIERARVLPPAQVVDIMTQVCRAVGKAHEAGIVHRDLKPDNIFLVPEDDVEIVKVLDFGIAKQTGTVTEQGAGSNTRTGALMGTPYYMSPEQARGNRSIDQRSDLWALGVITYECLLGRRPFDSDALGDLLMKICSEEPPVPSSVAAVPPAFDAWFARATQRDPAQRFQTARELAEALRAALQGAGEIAAPRYEERFSSPGAAPAVSLTTNGHSSASLSDATPSPAKGRSPLPAVAGAGALAVAVVGALFAFGRGGGASAEAAPPGAAVAAPVAVSAALKPEATAAPPPQVVPLVVVPSSSAPSTAAPAPAAAPTAPVVAARPRTAPAPAEKPRPAATAAPKPTAASGGGDLFSGRK